MEKAVLTIADVTVGYRQGKKNLPVVSGINASLHRGELVALIGKNGSGKSTLLRTISYFQKPLAGRIECCGKNIVELSTGDIAKELAVVLASAESAPLTVKEVVALGRTPYTGFLGRLTEDDECVVENAMDMMGVRCFENRLLSTLSDGERQKCMIAKALAQETSLILLDEPTAFLDFGSKVALFRTLKQLAKDSGKAILFSTHDIELAIRFADGMWLLSDGVLNVGSVSALSDNGALQRFVDGDGVKYDKENNRIEITEIQ